ncbi:30S ribosomal protein S2 [Thermostichus vulcanus]|uniref:Small ribosomal subunit protein uS2 n=1 Tax=Thermostichus vulcanus str. 'Rupite' TaxID=2813851 RepID=A0ABT0CCM0_THEVL|nr:30S ribosomal protein S2 [Thermostichus vulcanus]MCJ2543515.1 30S ribosomal protein S2 [Thermostichus vulcanus str. 'Rupite']
MSVVSLPQLLEAGVHFGHKASRWNPKMRPYIFTERNGIHIIDLVQTARYLNEAYEYVRDAADKGWRFLFIGTKRQAAGIIAQEARRCGSYFVNQRWLGGMLTNWATIRTRIDRLKEIEEMQSSGMMDRLPKQESARLKRELVKLEKYLGGIKTMRKLPDAVIIVDQRREANAIQECIKLNIPIISLLDTNCDPDLSDVFIPSNDDAIRAIKLIVGKLADAIYEGRHGQLDISEEDEFDYEGAMDLDEDGLDDLDEDEEGDSDETE